MITIDFAINFAGELIGLSSIEATHDRSIQPRAKQCHVPICLDDRFFPTIIGCGWSPYPISTHSRLILPIILGTAFDAQDTNPVPLYLTAKFSPSRSHRRQPAQSHHPQQLN
jgi:hypothetical protein